MAVVATRAGHAGPICSARPGPIVHYALALGKRVPCLPLKFRTQRSSSADRNFGPPKLCERCRIQVLLARLAAFWHSIVPSGGTLAEAKGHSPLRLRWATFWPNTELRLNLCVCAGKSEYRIGLQCVSSHGRAIPFATYRCCLGMLRLFAHASTAAQILEIRMPQQRVGCAEYCACLDVQETYRTRGAQLGGGPTHVPHFLMPTGHIRARDHARTMGDLPSTPSSLGQKMQMDGQ